MWPLSPKKTEDTTQDETIQIVFILDKSASMSSVKSDTIRGYNAFLQEQKELPGDADFTLVQFSTGVDNTYTSVPIVDANELTELTYRPSGWTALYDAIGAGIEAVQGSSKVLVAILTDGEENRSTEYTGTRIKELIKEKTAAGWEFVFLAANQDAFATGSGLGFSRSMCQDYTADAVGTRKAFATLGATTIACRSKN